MHWQATSAWMKDAQTSVTHLKNSQGPGCCGCVRHVPRSRNKEIQHPVANVNVLKLKHTGHVENSHAKVNKTIQSLGRAWYLVSLWYRWTCANVPRNPGNNWPRRIYVGDKQQKDLGLALWNKLNPMRWATAHFQQRIWEWESRTCERSTVLKSSLIPVNLSNEP
jgi:hypothetical protein